MDKGDFLLYVIGGGLLLIYLIQRPQGYTPLPLDLGTTYKLPITQHSDGHYYDANGVMVS